MARVVCHILLTGTRVVISMMDEDMRPEQVPAHSKGSAPPHKNVKITYVPLTDKDILVTNDLKCEGAARIICAKLMSSIKEYVTGFCAGTRKADSEAESRGLVIPEKQFSQEQEEIIFGIYLCYMHLSRYLPEDLCLEPSVVREFRQCLHRALHEWAASGVPIEELDLPHLLDGIVRQDTAWGGLSAFCAHVLINHHVFTPLSAGSLAACMTIMEPVCERGPNGEKGHVALSQMVYVMCDKSQDVFDMIRRLVHVEQTFCLVRAIKTTELDLKLQRAFSIRECAPRSAGAKEAYDALNETGDPELENATRQLADLLLAKIAANKKTAADPEPKAKRAPSDE
jgi:hypothetical protein